MLNCSVLVKFVVVVVQINLRCPPVRGIVTVEETVSTGSANASVDIQAGTVNKVSCLSFCRPWINVSLIMDRMTLSWMYINRWPWAAWSSSWSWMTMNPLSLSWMSWMIMTQWLGAGWSWINDMELDDHDSMTWSWMIMTHWPGAGWSWMNWAGWTSIDLDKQELITHE